MRIGIMGAMPEEVMHIIDHVTSKQNQIIGGREFTSGKLYGIDTIVTFSKWGKVASAITAVNLITNFNVDYLIFTGVAGAISENLNIGDIVLGEELYQHDLDGRPFFKKHQIPLTEDIFFNSCTNLIEKTKIAATKFISNLSNRIDKKILNKFKISNPQVVQGKIATGDQFIRSKEKVQLIRNDMQDALAVEMEGAAVAQVCKDHNVPFVAIRTISDNADQSAAIDFQEFINSVASIYSFEIIKELYKLFAAYN